MEKKTLLDIIYMLPQKHCNERLEVLTPPPQKKPSVLSSSGLAVEEHQILKQRHGTRYMVVLHYRDTQHMLAAAICAQVFML